jgi:hypothetical protein
MILFSMILFPMAGQQNHAGQNHDLTDVASQDVERRATLNR